MNDCKYCYIKNSCTIHPSTCTKRFSVYENTDIEKLKVDVRTDLINNIRNKLFSMPAFLTVNNVMRLLDDVGGEINENNI